MQTMISGEDAEVRIGATRGGAWSAAVDRYTQGHLPLDDDQLAMEWAAAGIADRSGRVADDWAECLEVAARGEALITITAIQGQTAFLTNVFLSRDPAVAVAVNTRASVTVNAEGREVVDVVDPLVDIARCPAARAWTVMRRVLPPLDAFRAPAPPTRPPATRTAPPPADGQTTARVFVAATDRARTFEFAWYAHESSLVRVSSGALFDVAPGDVAAELSSLAASLL